MPRPPGRGRRIAVAFVAALGGVTLLQAGAASAAPRVLTFDQAVRDALADNPGLAASQAGLSAAQASEDTARASRWPRLSASLRAVRSNDPLTVFGAKLSQRDVTFRDFGAAQFTGPGSLDVAPETLNHPGAYDNVNPRLSIEWPLYAGGRMGAAIARAHQAAAAARQGNVEARQGVILEVLQAYEGLRAAKAQLAVARRARKAARSYLQMARARFRKGTTIRSDVLTAKVRAEQADLDYGNAQDHVDLARANLRRLVNLPDDRQFTLGPPATPLVRDASLTSLQHRAEAHNPQLARLRHQAQSRKAAVDQARGAYRPDLALRVQRDWYDRTAGFAAPSYTVGLVASWDIFDFGQRSGKVDQADSHYQAAQDQARGYARRLRISVDRAWRAARRAHQQVQVSREAVGQSREAQRILRLRYQKGLVTITELLDGEARLEQAESDLVSARYALRVHRATLLARTGQLDLSHFAPANAHGTHQDQGNHETETGR